MKEIRYLPNLKSISKANLSILTKIKSRNLNSQFNSSEVKGLLLSNLLDFQVKSPNLERVLFKPSTPTFSTSARNSTTSTNYKTR